MYYYFAAHAWLNGMFSVLCSQRQSICVNDLDGAVDEMIDMMEAVEPFGSTQVTDGGSGSPDSDSETSNPLSTTGVDEENERISKQLRRQSSELRADSITSLTDFSGMSTRERIKNQLLNAAEKTKSAIKDASGGRRIPEDLTFQDYMPELFQQVRDICKIVPEEYVESFQRTTKESFSEGASGAFLYFSGDMKYLVKTTSKGENQALLNIMEDYLGYMVANPDSLFVKFLGAHSLTIYEAIIVAIKQFL